MTTLLKSFLLLNSLLFLVACGGDDDNNKGGNDNQTEKPSESTTVVDAAIADGNFTTLVAALEATGLDATLSNPDGSFTVFAPTDEAFDKLGAEAINTLLNDTDTLSDILLYHVVSGAEINADTAVASAGDTITMGNGKKLALSLTGESLYANLAMVTATDIQTDNGIIHVIDTVITPPSAMGETMDNIVETAVAAGSFTTLVTALQATELDAVLADETKTFTVFAPTDDAFAKLGDETINALLADTDKLSSVLLQHVISGSGVDAVTAFSMNGANISTAAETELMLKIEDGELMFGGSTVTVFDIHTNNGIIHVIDTVITEGIDLSPVTPSTIVDLATDAGNFTTLITALEATGLSATLSNPDGSFTVFAPTDEAFAKLGEETIAALLADTDTLSDILLYHVIVDTEVNAAAAIASAGTKVDMANGNSIALSLSGESLYINLSMITGTDIMADNGIIHVIDTVLLPPSDMGAPTANIVDTAIAAGNFTTLVTALQAADLDEVLADETKDFTVFAPTDAAFDALGVDTINALLADTDELSRVLLKHVVSDLAVDSLTAFTLNGMDVETAGGETVMLKVENNSLMVHNSTVTTFDIYTNNGIIHVIDTVITD